MSIIATLKRIETDGHGLSNDKRPGIMDGSLSEIITQALNYSRSRRDYYTGEPNFGQPNPEVETPPGGGTVTNIKHMDEPFQNPLRPSLETQAMDVAMVEEIADQLGESIVDARDEAARNEIKGKPVLIYAIPEDNKIPEEMNSEIDDYIESNAVQVSDFVFIHTDAGRLENEERVVDASTKVTEMQAKGAKVYQDLNSFLADLPVILKKR